MTASERPLDLGAPVDTEDDLPTFSGPPDGLEGVLDPWGAPPALRPAFWAAMPVLPEPKQVHLGIRYIDVATTAASGRLLDASAAFPIRGVEIDNYSRLWLYLPSIARYIPPYTFGFSCPVHFAPVKIEVHAQAPPGFLQIASSSTESFCVTCKEVELSYSPGLPVPPQPGNVNTGAYGYAAGTSAATVNVPSNGKVIGITLLATSAGAATWVVGAGATVTAPASAQIASGVNGQLVGGTITFAGSVASYLVEWVV